MRVVMVSWSVAACEAGAGSGVATAVPTRAGDVWEIDSVAARRTGGADLLAFVSGTHVLIIDGDATYAGTQLTRGGRGPDGGQPLALGGGIQAILAPAGAAMQLRFASGETLPLRKRLEGATP